MNSNLVCLGVRAYHIDPKSRVCIPHSWRPTTGESLILMLSRRHGMSVLKVFGEAAFEELMKMVSEGGATAEGKKPLAESLAMFSREAILDEHGRLPIPADLREMTGIVSESEVALVGCGDHFEIWNQENYAAMLKGLVFISAANEDYPYAGELYDFLTSRGLPVFFSERSLNKLGKSDYRHAIDEALEKSVHMAVVTSSRANVRKSWVEAEWGLFINEIRGGYKKGNLIVMIAGSAQPHDLPPSLRNYEIIPFDAKGFEKALHYLDTGDGQTDSELDILPPFL